MAVARAMAAFFFGIPPLDEMGGKDGPANMMIVTRNLGNSAHYDFDRSESFIVWSEEVPGRADGWFFVFPDASINGSKGVVVKMFHGLNLSYDGRKIRHCTSKTNVGKGNNVYGCFVASK